MANLTSGNISQNNIVTQPYVKVDIGGSNLETVSGNSGWVRLASRQAIMIYVTVDAFDAADTLDTFQIEEAKDKNGLGAVLLTGNALPVLAADVTAGAVFVLECVGSELATGFGFVRLNAAATGNTGVDQITVVYIRDKANTDLTIADARI